jgi:hypothetical protein
MSRSHPTDARRLPGLTKAGLAVIGFGLLLDVVEHGFGPVANGPAMSGFSIGEHLAHLIVLVGMVVVLVGIVADGVRLSRSRPARPERSTSHAVR